ncbi:GFA family protein [Aliiroseovarius sp. S1339]|uniref:GFA family protein n=1 Tax=Aliiroseovarius sp. S1339 TaxID=2936990 RepID=UPI0020BE4A13|nr:GFA family protein [Aliiroseovarius sp. S1339]MCK8464214.1 GFA family protein [Aliiroseovarius sp. S1339]
MPKKIKGACHCGAVTFEVSPPEFVVSCNCSICRRYGALWAHCPPNEGAILSGQDNLTTYSWGDRLISFHFCKACGCMTHWGPGESAETDRFAVNLRMAPPEVTDDLKIRRFDGANTWDFLD